MILFCTGISGGSPHAYENFGEASNSVISEEQTKQGNEKNPLKRLFLVELTRKFYR